jgi:hypothetical protein
VVGDTGDTGHAGDTVTEESRSTSTGVVVLRTFTVLLSGGVLLHEIQLGSTPWGLHAVVLVAAVLGLTRPGIPTLVGLFAALALELLLELPNPFNHTAVLGVVGGGVALWWVLSGVLDRQAAWRHDAGAFLARVGPVVRVAVLMTWGLAFFAKLNTGFLDTAQSCAIWILEQIPAVAVPGWATSGVVAGTLIVEALVPLLLLVPHTRVLGVAAAWGFHVVAAIGGHTAFSAIALSLYLFFLHPEHVRASVAWVAGRLPRRATLASWWSHPATAVTLLALWVGGITLIQHAPAPWDARGRRFVPTVVYLPLAASYAAALVAGFRRSRSTVAAGAGDGQGLGLRLRGAVPVLIVLTLALNAANPYLGLKTGWSLAMYSNLRTEPGQWNHLVVPEEARVFGWQDDLIAINDAHPDVARSLGLGSAAEPAEVPRLRVLRVAADHPDAPVQLAPGEEPVPVSDLAEGDFTFVHDRLAHLRAVPATPRCQF